MNIKTIAISLIFLAIFIAGCTTQVAQEQVQEATESANDLGNETIDDLFNEYNGEIGSIDLGEMI